MTNFDITGPKPGDRMERKSGGGWLMLFGLPFIAAGPFIMLTALGVSGVPMDGDIPAFLLFILGLLFVGAGAGLIFGRSGVIIDRAAMKVTKWWGLLVPFKVQFKVTEYNLADFDRITVGKEVRTDSNSSKMVFPVRLAGGGGVADLEYDAPTDYPAARRLSEELARFLGRDIEDTISGRAVRRQLEDLDETVG